MPTPTEAPVEFANTQAKFANSSEGIKLTWNLLDHAEGYKIYRRNGSTGYKLIATLGPTVHAYTDKNVLSGTTYVYAVRAYKGDIQSRYSPKSLRYLSSPESKLSNETTGIKVSWNAISGAKGYEIYRMKGTSGSYTKVATLQGKYKTTYMDTQVVSGSGYSYAVKAFGDNAISNHKRVTLRYLAVPKITALTWINSGVKITWSKTSGSKGYYVYRKEGSGKYEKIATRNGAGILEYVDKTAKKGVTYTYSVRAFNGTVLSAVSFKKINLR